MSYYELRETIESEPAETSTGLPGQNSPEEGCQSWQGPRTRVTGTSKGLFQWIVAPILSRASALRPIVVFFDPESDVFRPVRGSSVFDLGMRRPLDHTRPWRSKSV